MEQSPRLSLSYVAPSQAQKHVTVNETFRRLDALVQMRVRSQTVSAQPTAPDEGDGYILPPSPTGPAWSNYQPNDLAFFQDGAWISIAGVAGMRAYVADDDRLVVYDGAVWTPVGGGTQSASFGVNTSADATNRLSVKSDAVLFSHDDVTPGSGDARVKVNKAVAGDTASHLFQTGFSGRAEFGLTGDDDFRVKVSADGVNWNDAMVVDKSNGTVNFPAGGARNQLTAPRTYYVSTTGSDSNDGLTPGAPFATIQKAVDAAAALDISIHDLTIQLADGTYDLGGTGVKLKSVVGAGKVAIQGNASTPSNVTVKTSGGVATDVFAAVATTTIYEIKDMKIETAVTTGACRGIYSHAGSYVQFSNLVTGDFDDPSVGILFHATDTSIIEASGDLEIAGSCRRAFQAAGGAIIRVAGVTVTLTGTPNWSQAYLFGPLTATFNLVGTTFSGSATGQQYDIQRNSVASTGGVALPGDVAGTADTGAQIS